MFDCPYNSKKMISNPIYKLYNKIIKIQKYYKFLETK